MNRIFSDFVIDSKDHCFFCMAKTSPELHSLQYFSRFLRMDMKRVFIEKGAIPANLIAKVEMSRLQAKLCARCVSLNETFSKLRRRLEKIEMEVVSSLKNICSEVLKAEGSKEYQNLLNTPEDSEDEWEAKLGILQVVRKEAIQKCSTTIQRRGPRVRVLNMTKTNITKMKQKHELKSGRQIKSDMGCQMKLELVENFTNPSFENPDVNHEVDFGSERGSPPSSTPWEEEAFVKNEHEKSTPGTKNRYVNKWLSDSRISKNIETIKLTDKRPSQKVRCRLCRKIYARRFHVARHIKSVHLKEKSFKCPQCLKMFSYKHNMETHMRIHSGFKAYKCPVCFKDFRQKATMRRHLAIHTGRRHDNK